MANLTPELEKARAKIVELAKEAGLDFFETIFELVNYTQLNEIAARGGFPVRYPHWRFGMEYESLKKGYEYGLSKIYELVINNDPCYAYLLEGNDIVDQKLVMAHVCGHSDFFKNNMWFSQTDRKMIDSTANHAMTIRRYIDKYGQDTVEDFIDKCISLDNLIDIYGPYSSQKIELPKAPPKETNPWEEKKVDMPSREHMENFLKPEGSVDKRTASDNNDDIFPEKPMRDVMHFLMQYAPLEDWQREVVNIIRKEAYYFAPQGMTKIMNEGWASYWHSKLMTEKIMDDSEIIDFADRHSGAMTMAPGGFNPYKVGIELFRNIEERWDKGQFGKEWLECKDLGAKENWDRKLGLGREKIFEVRRNYNDVTFIDDFLTEDFCVKNKMFVYKFNKRTGQFEVDTRDFDTIKKKFLFQLTNFGHPIISIVDANFMKRGELLFGHLFEGVEMQPDFMQETMKNVYALWKRPVHIATVMDGEGRIFTWDGKEFKSMPFAELPVTGEDNKTDSDGPEKKKA